VHDTLRSSPQHNTCSAPSLHCCTAHSHATHLTHRVVHTYTIAHTQVVTRVQHVLYTFIVLLQCARTRHILHTQSYTYFYNCTHSRTGHHHSTARAPHLHCTAAMHTHPPHLAHAESYTYFNNCTHTHRSSPQHSTCSTPLLHCCTAHAPATTHTPHCASPTRSLFPACCTCYVLASYVRLTVLAMDAECWRWRSWERCWRC